MRPNEKIGHKHMKIEKIKELLEKFYRGETSRDEEYRLMQFFRQENVPSELEADRKVLLSLVGDEIKIPDGMEQKLESLIGTLGAKEAQKPVRKTVRLRYALVSIAATLLLLIGVGILYQQHQKKQDLFADTYKNPDEAYQATMQALEVFSENFSKGVEPLEKAGEHIEETQKIVNKSINK